MWAIKRETLENVIVGDFEPIENVQCAQRILDVVNRIVAVLPERVPVKVYLDRDESSMEIIVTKRQ